MPDLALGLSFSDIPPSKLPKLPLNIDLPTIVGHQIRRTNCILPIRGRNNLGYQSFELVRRTVALTRHTNDPHKNSRGRRAARVACERTRGLLSVNDLRIGRP